MALSGKLIVNVEIESPGEMFLAIFGTKKYDLPKIAPNDIGSIQLLKGDWGAVGCTIRNHFLLDGQTLVSEESIIDVDEKNKSITYNLHGGDLMKLYKKMDITFQITTTGEKNYLKWTYDYEKISENIVGAEEQLVPFITRVTKDLDAHFLKAKN